jgi:hypothetical protein
LPKHPLFREEMIKMEEQRVLNKELIAIISTFNTKDYTRLRAFMNSDYFMEQFVIKQSVTQLMALLTYFESNRELSYFSREAAHIAVFSNGKKKKKSSGDEIGIQLDRVTTSFLNIVKDFLFWSRQEKNDFEESFMLAKFYFEKELYDEFLRYYKKSKDTLSNFPSKDATHFYKQFELETLYNEYLALHDTHGKNKLNLLEMIQALNNFYAVHSLEWLIVVKNRHKFVKQDGLLMSNAETLTTLIAQLTVGFNLKSDILEAYNRILALMNDEPTFERSKILELRDLLEKKDLKGIPFDNLIEMKGYTRNFLQYRYDHLKRKNLNGVIDALKDFFDIHKLHWNNGSEDNALLRHGTISPNLIQNFTTVALKLHQHYSTENQSTEYSDWVRDFIEELENSKSRINNKDGEADDIINLCKANYYLSIKDYKNAEKSALYVKYKNPYRQSLANIILIEIYYMTKIKLYTEKLENFRIWLTKQKNEGTMPEEKIDLIRKTLNDRLKIIKQQKR